MSDFTRIHIDEAPTSEELARMRNAAEAPKAAPTVRTGGFSSISISDGKPTYVVDRHAIRVETPHIDPNLVTIHGITTTRQAAIAAGMLSPDGEPNLGKLEAGASEDASLRQQSENEQKSESQGQTEIDNATETLTKIAEVLGAETVEAYVLATAESGEIPEKLPQGVTMQQAQTAMAGYVAQAENALGKAGASIALLQE